MIEVKKKYLPIVETDSRYFIVSGGRGSGKSFSVNALLVMLTYEAGHTILFTRYTLTSAYISIIPDFIGYSFMIHNGKSFIPITVSEEMVGHKLGEFAPTRTFKGHTPADKKAAPAKPAGDKK